MASWADSTFTAFLVIINIFCLVHVKGGTTLFQATATTPAAATVGLISTRTTAQTDLNKTVIYTIGGNAGGDPCLFPFTFMGVSYTSCTTAGRSDNLKWCATTSNYAKDFIWGICPEPVDGCGEFWIEGQFGKYCYQFNFQSSLTWLQARDACRQQNADMLSIVDPKEQAWIAGRIHIVTTVMWLGLSDMTVEGNWEWSDGSPLTYLNWREGQPNSYGGNEDCGAIITRSGMWGDTPCSRHLSFICRKIDETKANNNQVTTAGPNISSAWVLNVDCYTGYGEDYKGNVSKIANGNSCLDWATQSNPYGLTGSNCRNPDHSQMPWCYTGTSSVDWGYCDIPTCKGKKYCQSGWKSLAGRCFMFGCTIPSAWTTAQQMCKKQGATLARIATKSELTDILVWIAQIKPWLKYHTKDINTIWLGLNDKAHEMQFQWDDNVVPTFTFWAKDQPDDVLGTSDCVQMRLSDGRWNDVDCNLKWQYLCMKVPTESMKAAESIADGTCFDRQSHGSHDHPKSDVTLQPGMTGAVMPVDTTPLVPTAGCPDGWVGFSASCYRFEHDVTNWTVAYHICSSRYGNTSKIIIPSNRYEQAFLSSVAAKFDSSVSFHLNVLAITTSFGSWHFFDTDLVMHNRSVRITYTNWDRLQPNTLNVANDSIGMCVSMAAGNKAGLWKVGNCRDMRRVACSLPREGVTLPPPPPTTPVPPGCPDGWKALNSKCYKAYVQIFRKQRKTWSEARRSCQLLGGPANEGHADLISVHSETQLSLLKTSVLPYWVPGGIWLGLSDRNAEDTWKWSDGSPLDYISWGNGEPNNSGDNEHCVEYSSRGKTWNDLNCNRLRNWICQIDPGSTIYDPINMTTPIPATCGDPAWNYFNGSCYYFSTRTRKSYFEAQKDCESRGANLVSISNQDEQDYLHVAVQRRSLPEWWIGLDMKNKEEEFRWTDGTLYNFRSWAKNEPNYANKQEGCAEMYMDSGFWNDMNCGKVLSYICKRSNDTQAPGTTTKPIYNPTGFCPGDWLEYRGYCMKIMGTNVTERLNWTDARDECMATGGNLLSIANAQQQAFLTSHLSTLQNIGPMWIGLNDLNGEGRFFWRDGTEYRYSNWNHGEPNSPGYRSKGALDDCVNVVNEKWSVGKWADERCNKNMSYICEMHKSVSADRLCADHPDSNWPTQCQEIVRDKSCRRVRHRLKKACMKSCGYCSRFVKPPKKVDPSNGLCKSGWRYWNKDCWMLTKESFTWEAAKDMCESKKSTLATLSDEFSEAWAFSMLSDPTENPDTATPGGVRAWIGLKRKKQDEGSYTYSWISKWPTLFTKWGPGQPSTNMGSLYDCVSMDGTTSSYRRRNGGYWFNAKCNETLPALCQQTKKMPPKNLTTYPGKCPSNWKAYKDNCYYFASGVQTSSWYKADYECRKMGANVVSIHSQDETRFVMTNAGSSRRTYQRPNIWIGMYRELSDDSFIWSDGTDVDFYNWAPNEPSKGNGYHKELCTELTVPSGQWNDNSCSRMGITVCKMPKMLPQINPPTAQVSASSDVGIAVGLSVVIVILVVAMIVMVVYRNHSTKSKYSLHLPSVSFRDFFAFPSKRMSSADDNRGLMDAQEDGYH